MRVIPLECKELFNLGPGLLDFEYEAPMLGLLAKNTIAIE
jgi:hypothetical protein